MLSNEYPDKESQYSPIKYYAKSFKERLAANIGFDDCVSHLKEITFNAISLKEIIEYGLLNTVLEILFDQHGEILNNLLLFLQINLKIKEFLVIIEENRIPPKVLDYITKVDKNWEDLDNFISFYNKYCSIKKESYKDAIIPCLREKSMPLPYLYLISRLTETNIIQTELSEEIINYCHSMNKHIKDLLENNLIEATENDIPKNCISDKNQSFFPCFSFYLDLIYSLEFEPYELEGVITELLMIIRNYEHIIFRYSEIYNTMIYNHLYGKVYNIPYTNRVRLIPSIHIKYSILLFLESISHNIDDLLIKLPNEEIQFFISFNLFSLFSTKTFTQFQSLLYPFFKFLFSYSISSEDLFALFNLYIKENSPEIYKSYLEVFFNSLEKPAQIPYFILPESGLKYTNKTVNLTFGSWIKWRGKSKEPRDFLTYNNTRLIFSRESITVIDEKKNKTTINYCVTEWFHFIIIISSNKVIIYLNGEEKYNELYHMKTKNELNILYTEPIVFNCCYLYSYLLSKEEINQLFSSTVENPINICFSYEKTIFCLYPCEAFVKDLTLNSSFDTSNFQVIMPSFSVLNSLQAIGGVTILYPFLTTSMNQKDFSFFFRMIHVCYKKLNSSYHFDIIGSIILRISTFSWFNEECLTDLFGFLDGMEWKEIKAEIFIKIVLNSFLYINMDDSYRINCKNILLGCFKKENIKESSEQIQKILGMYDYNFNYFFSFLILTDDIELQKLFLNSINEYYMCYIPFLPAFISSLVVNNKTFPKTFDILIVEIIEILFNLSIDCIKDLQIQLNMVCPILKSDLDITLKIKYLNVIFNHFQIVKKDFSLNDELISSFCSLSDIPIIYSLFLSYLLNISINQNYTKDNIDSLIKSMFSLPPIFKNSLKIVHFDSEACFLFCKILESMDLEKNIDLLMRIKRTIIQVLEDNPSITDYLIKQNFIEQLRNVLISYSTVNTTGNIIIENGYIFGAVKESTIDLSNIKSRYNFTRDGVKVVSELIKYLFTQYLQNLDDNQYKELIIENFILINSNDAYITYSFELILSVFEDIIKTPLDYQKSFIGYFYQLIKLSYRNNHYTLNLYNILLNIVHNCNKCNLDCIKDYRYLIQAYLYNIISYYIENQFFDEVKRVFDMIKNHFELITNNARNQDQPFYGRLLYFIYYSIGKGFRDLQVISILHSKLSILYDSKPPIMPAVELDNMDFSNKSEALAKVKEYEISFKKYDVINDKINDKPYIISSKPNISKYNAIDSKRLLLQDIFVEDILYSSTFITQGDYYYRKNIKQHLHTHSIWGMDLKGFTSIQIEKTIKWKLDYRCCKNHTRPLLKVNRKKLTLNEEKKNVIKSLYIPYHMDKIQTLYDSLLFVIFTEDIKDIICGDSKVFNCSFISESSKIDGIVVLTKNSLYCLHYIKYIEETNRFIRSEASTECIPKRFDIKNIYNTRECRYLLQQVGVEIYFLNGKSILLVFLNTGLRRIFINKLTNYTVDKDKSKTQIQRIKDESLKWSKYKITTMDYLLELNSLAGRSYNDLTQYYVFPWVISDYSSEKLDLNNKNSYRDLSLPMGALDSERLKHFDQKFENSYNFDHVIGQYFYGTHYSNLCYVLSFLVRLDPFSDGHIELQGGHFDISDRLFMSIEDSWNSCSKYNTQDVRELIPEFYYFPLFLLNFNKYYFGTTQNGVLVDDVILPKWSKDTHMFIDYQRKALESDLVSSKINEWIDLIFGYKQKGNEAKKSKNLFYPFSYEDGIDINSSEFHENKDSIQGQIREFGQVPSQLFTNKHIERDMYEKKVQYKFGYPLSVLNEALKQMERSKVEKNAIGFHVYGNKDFRIDDKKSVKVLENKSTVYSTFYFQQNPSYIIYGYPDYSFRYFINDKLYDIYYCQSEITAIHYSEANYLFVGTKSGLIYIYLVDKTKFKFLYNSDYLRVLLSSDEKGNCFLWSLTRWSYIRTIHSSPDSLVDLSINNKTGAIICLTQQFLYLYDINGYKLLVKKNDISPFSKCLMLDTENYLDDIYLITGHEDGNICYWSYTICDEKGERNLNRNIIYKVSDSSVINLMINEYNGKSKLITLSSNGEYSIHGTRIYDLEQILI